MTKVKIYKGKNGRIKKFSIEGHTEYDDIGYDIVCSAISTAVQSVIIGLEEVVKMEDFTYVISDALIECDISDNLDLDKSEKADILLDTMLLVLKQINEQYVDYMNIEEISFTEV